MELHAFAIGVVVFVFSAFLTYVITAIFMKEKSFDEVLAEQQRLREEDRKKNKKDKKVEKELLKRKYKKGKGVALKEKNHTKSVSPDLQATVVLESEVLNDDIKAEIIEPTKAIVYDSNISNSQSKSSQKLFTHDTNDVSNVYVSKSSKNLQKLSKHQQKRCLSNNDVNIKKEKSSKVEESGHSTVCTDAISEVNKENIHEPQVEVIKIKPVQMKSVNKASINKSKDSSLELKKSPLISSSQAIEAIQGVQFNDMDREHLVEILFNLQGSNAAESWIKKLQKGDQAVTMKKQLEEKEQALHGEKQLAVAANAKVKELSNELSVERANVASMKKDVDDKMTVHAGELEAMHGRIRQAHEQHLHDAASLQMRIKQLEKAGDIALVQKVKQENIILQDALRKTTAEMVPVGEVSNLRQKVAIMEKEFCNNAIRLNASDNLKKSHEDKIKRLEDHVNIIASSKQSIDDSLSKKIEELKMYETKNNTLTFDLNNASGAAVSAEAEISVLNGKLQELEDHLSAVESNSDLEARFQHAEQINQKLERNIKNLEMRLADAVHVTMAAKFQESETRNEVESTVENLERQLYDVVNHRSNMSAELENLHQENMTLRQERSMFKEQQHNHIVASSNGHLNGSEPFIHIMEHELIVLDKDKELSLLKMELDSLQVSSSQLPALMSQVSNLEMQLNAHRDLMSQLDIEKERNTESAKQVEDLVFTVKNLEELLSKVVCRHDTMSIELETLRETNVDLRLENNMLRDQQPNIASALCSENVTSSDSFIHVAEHERVLSEKDKELSHLQMELDSQQSFSEQVPDLKAQVCSLETELKDQVEHLQAELDEQKERNNLLRERNWKAMDALNKSEQLMTERIEQSVKVVKDNVKDAVSAVQAANRNAFLRLFPSISIDDASVYPDWLVTFEGEAAKHLNTLSTSVVSDREHTLVLQEEIGDLCQQAFRHQMEMDDLIAENVRLLHSEEKISSTSSLLADEVSELQLQKRQLQVMLEDRDRSITDAGVLLHHLESVVELEENKWQQRLQEAEGIISKNSEFVCRVQELEMLTGEQGQQIEHYRNVLSNTEALLSRLETAEEQWEVQLQTSESEMLKVKSEYASLEDDVKSKRACTETQSQLADFQWKLNRSKEEANLLSNENQQMQGVVKELQAEVFRCTERMQLLSREKDEVQLKADKLEEVLLKSTEHLDCLKTESQEVQRKADMLNEELVKSMAMVEALLIEKQEVQLKADALEAELIISTEKLDCLAQEKQKVQSKVDMLEVELSNSTEKLDCLAQEKQQMCVNHLALIQSKVDMLHEDLSKSSQTLDALIKERQEGLDSLNAQLNLEQGKNRDLSANMIHLNGIIKTGQDALLQEQELVKHLRDQLNQITGVSC